MATYLPPVLLHLRVSARDAYAELAKFQAAVETTMAETAAAVNAQGAVIGAKAGTSTGQAAGKAAAKAVQETFAAEMKKRAAGWARALNIDTAAHAAGVRMAQVALRAYSADFGRWVRRAVTYPFVKAADLLKPIAARMATIIGAPFRKVGDLAGSMGRRLQPFMYLFGALGVEALNFGRKTVDAFKRVGSAIKTVYDRSGPLKWLIQGHIKAFKLLGGAAVKAFTEVLPWVGKIAAGLSVAAVAAQYLSVRMVALGRGIASLGPLVAFLPALVGSVVLLKKSLSAVSDGIKAKLKPVSEAFQDAEKHAANLAGRGIAPIGREFLKVNFPSIRTAMNDIAVSANGAARQFGKWLNSAPGMKLVQSISRGTADAFRILAPKVEKAAEALGRLANRAQIAHRIRETGEAIGVLADKFRRWANSKSTKDVENALRTVGDAFSTIGDKVKMVKDVIVWMAANGDKVKRFSDALAVAGIAIGLFTGPIGVILGSLTLLANHWDTVKKSFSDTGALGKVWDTLANDPSVQSFVVSAKKNWQAFKDGFTDTLPVIRAEWAKVWPQFKRTLDELGPLWEQSQPFIRAFGTFLGVSLAGMATSVRGFLKTVEVIAAVFKKVATIVGGIMNGLMNNVVAPTLDALGTAIGVFDKDLGAKMHNAAAAVRTGAANIQRYIDGINGKNVYVNIYMRTVGRNNSGATRAQNNAQAIRDVRGNATGTTHWQGGQTVVGEYGPEVVDLPRGAQVHTAGESQLMAAHAATASRRSPARSLGSSILSSVLSGMKDAAPAVFKYLRAFSNRIATMKVSTATKTRVQNIVSDYLPKFATLKNIEDAIDRQKQKIQGLISARRQYAQSVAQANYGGAASLIGAIPAAGSGGTGNLGSDYAKVLEDRANKLREFRRNLEALKGRGLSKRVLSEFAAAGAEQSGDLVQSLMGSSDGVLGTINRSSASLAAGSKALGSRWASQMYDAGIQAAQGVLKGLRSQRAALKQEMMRLAKSLVGAIRKALGIRSPSSVMADEVGRFIPEGVARGVTKHAWKAASAVRAMARASVPSTGRVPLGGAALAGAVAGGVSGGRTADGGDIHTHVYLDGREIYSSVQTRALNRQRRNGTNGLTANNGTGGLATI